MRFTETGEFEIHEQRLAFAGIFSGFRRMVIQIGFGLVGLVILIHLIRLLV